MPISPPTDRPTWESEIATMWMSDEGIIISWSKPIQRTAQNISANAELVERITGGRPKPVLVHLCPSPMPDRSTRDRVNAVLPEMYTAMAMVDGGGLVRVIMNILFKLNKPPIPIRNFSTEKEALVWLRTFQEEVVRQ